MHSIGSWFSSEKKVYPKALLLFGTSYFFLAVSGDGFFLVSGLDTLINFLFTVLCVYSNWVLFKMLLVKFSVSDKHLWVSLRYVFGVSLILAAYTTLLNWIYIDVFWNESLLQTRFFPVVLPLALLLFIFWGLTYQNVKRFLLHGTTEISPHAFQVRRGREVCYKSLDQVYGFLVEHKLVFLLGFDGQRYIIEKPLTELEQLLEGHDFFRINRQVLIRRESVASYKTVRNEKVEVRLKGVDGIDNVTYVSRHRASAFRKWINNPPFSI